MPFHLHARYPGAYTCPAFLISFGVPPLGAFGFPHVPQTSPMESRQVTVKYTKKSHFFDRLQWARSLCEKSEGQVRSCQDPVDGGNKRTRSIIMNQKQEVFRNETSKPFHSVPLFDIGFFCFCYRNILVSSTRRISCSRILIASRSTSGRERTWLRRAQSVSQSTEMVNLYYSPEGCRSESQVCLRMAGVKASPKGMNVSGY